MSFVLLGILNSQAAGAVGAGAYDLLETTTLASSASSVSFTGLGSYSDYKHLQIRAVARSTDSSGDELIFMQMNSDTGSNYSVHGIFGNGSTVGSFGLTSQTKGRLFTIGNAVESSNIFGAGVTDILDFSSTSKNTTVRSLGGIAGTTDSIRLNSFAYLSTSAVTSLFLYLESGTNFVAGSRFSLYGIK